MFRLVLVSAGLLGLASCALPARPVTAAASGGRVYDQPNTGSLLASTDPDDERIGKNGDPSLRQPSFGTGSPGYIQPGSSR